MLMPDAGTENCPLPAAVSGCGAGWTASSSPQVVAGAATQSDAGVLDGAQEGGFYLLTDTLVEGRSIFWSERDLRRYLSIARQQWAEYGIRVHAYCFLPDGVHWLVNEAGDWPSMARSAWVLPTDVDGAEKARGSAPPAHQRIGRAMMVIKSLSSRLFNQSLAEQARPVQLPAGVLAGGIGRSGNLLPAAVADSVVPKSSRKGGHNWLRDFGKCAVAEAKVKEVARRIELMPVLAGLVARAEEYSFSSYRERVAPGQGLLALDRGRAEAFAVEGSSWAAYVAAGEAELAAALARQRAQEEEARQQEATARAANARLAHLVQQARELVGLGERGWPARPAGVGGRLRHFVKQAVAYWQTGLEVIVVGFGRHWVWWPQAIREGWFAAGRAGERGCQEALNQGEGPGRSGRKGLGGWWPGAAGEAPG